MEKFREMSYMWYILCVIFKTPFSRLCCNAIISRPNPNMKFCGLRYGHILGLLLFLERKYIVLSCSRYISASEILLYKEYDFQKLQAVIKIKRVIIVAAIVIDMYLTMRISFRWLMGSLICSRSCQSVFGASERMSNSKVDVSVDYTVTQGTKNTHGLKYSKSCAGFMWMV